MRRAALKSAKQFREGDGRRDEADKGNADGARGELRQAAPVDARLTQSLIGGPVLEIG